MLVEFGEWMPDLPPLNNPGCVLAQGCIPMGRGYEPFPTASIYSTNTMDARAQGAFSCRDADGTVFNFSGNASKLYRNTSAAFSNISKAGGYTTGTDERWSFTQFGRRVIATNFTDNVQSYVMGTSSAFADLAGSPPRARYCTTLKDFVVLANTADSPARVQWSALSDATSWTVSAATGADYQDLDTSKGWIRQIVGGEYGVVFQERAITRMTFVGAPLWFQFDEVESERGTQAPGSVVKVGNTIFYLGTDLRFYAFNGTSSVPIGSNRVDKTFAAAVDTTYIHKVSACRDPRKPIVYWAFPGPGSSAGACNYIYAYNYQTDRWASVFLDEPVASYGEVDLLHLQFAEGYTLDGLDTVNSSIDALPYSLDSAYWTGGQISLAAFTPGIVYQVVFDSAAYIARFTSRELEAVPGYRATVKEIRPIVQGYVTLSAAIAVRETQAASAIGYAWGAPNTAGYIRGRASGRYHAASLTLTGGFTHAIGVDVTDVTPLGRR